MKHLFASIMLASVASIASAQYPHAYSEVFHSIDTTYAKGDVLLRITNIDFLKNDEYFSDYIEGYTLIGYQLRPSIVCYFTPQIAIEAGAQMLQYGGTTKYDNVALLLTAQWRINNWATLIMGTLDGHLSHNLPESMWEPERQLFDKPEMGVQMKINRPHLNAEVWLNWQQFIKPNDTIPEKFTVGMSAHIKPQRTADAPWTFEVPLQMIVSHIGGQISDFSERMQSLANGSATIILRKNFSRHWLQSIGTELQAQFFHAMVDGNVRPFSDGWAFYPQLTFSATNFAMNVGYWRASNYFSLYGNCNYMSLSNYKAEKYSKNRNLIVAEANFYHSVQRILKFAIGGKLYSDVDASQLDYSYHIDLIITPMWKIYGSDRKAKK